MDDFIVGPQCEEMGLMEEVHNMVDEMWDAVAAEIGKDIAKELRVESIEHIPMDDRIKELAKKYNVVLSSNPLQYKVCKLPSTEDASHDYD